MHKHDSSKGGLMPTYNDDFEWQGIKVSGKPAGIQSIPGLGRILRKWPLFTGSRRPFSIHIWATDAERKGETITLERFVGGPGGTDSSKAKSEQFSLRNKAKIIRVQPKRMMAMGEGQVRLWKVKP